MPKRKGSSSGNESTTAEQKMKKQKTEKAKLKPKKTEDKKEKGVPSKIDFSSSQAAFESLISPTKCEEFFDKYWEKQPLVLNRGEISYYGDLFTKENLFSILKQNKILYEDDINVCRFVDGEKEMLNSTGQAKEEKIKKDFKSLKATVQFHQPQRFKDEIWQLNAALEKEFGCLVGANVYITPAGAQGLAPHYDDIEAFILQLEGKKQWSLYKPPIELPQDYSADLTEDVIGEPTHKILLEPGDLLYFPRGTVHEAQTPEDQDHSTHITLSTYQNNNWGNLINHGLTQALERAMEEDVEFRRGLPMKYLDFMGYTKSVDADESTSEQNGKAKTEPSVDADVVEKQEKFTATLTKLLTRLADFIDPHSAADEMAIDFMSSRLPPFLPSDDKSEDKCEKTGQPPDDNSEVKLLYPGYVRMCVSSGPDRSDDEDDDEEDEEEDEDDTISEEEEDIEESSEEEESKKRSKNAKKKASKKSKADKKEQNKKSKQEKGKKSKEQENSTEGSEDDESMDEDEEDDEEDEYQGEDDLGEDWIVLYHSVSNDRSNHMIGVPKPYALKFPLSHKDALLQIINRSSEYLLVSSLPLPKADRLKMVTSLWAEGLLEVKQEAS